MATLPPWGERHAPRGDERSPVTNSAGFLEPTFNRAARIWWAWLWRSVVFGGAAGLFGSVVLSLSGVLEHISEKASQVLSTAVGVALAVPVGIWVFQMILEKDFGDFRIRLAPKPSPAVSPSPMDEPG
jgi:hypothetical protein